MILKDLIAIFKTFSKAEAKRFGKFVDSEYFNTNKRIGELYKRINKFYPYTDVSGISKEKIFKEIYEDKEFNDKTFRYLLSELYKLCEQYLLQSHLEKNPLKRDKLTAAEFSDRNLLAETETYLLSAINEVCKQKKFDLEFFSELSELFADMQTNIFRTGGSPLQDKGRSSEYFVYYVIAYMAHVYNNLLARKVNFNLKVEELPDFIFAEGINIEAILEYLNKFDDESETQTEYGKVYTAMKIYLNFIAAMKDVKDEKHFYIFKELVKKYSHIYTRAEQYNIYVMMESCCGLKRTWIDDLKFRKEYFEMKKEILEKGLHSLYEENYMEVRNFRSVAQVAISLKEYEWTKEFAEKHIDKIAPEYREELYNFTYAELFFAEGKFETALEHINKVSFKFEELKRFVKNITLKIYYELNYTEQAISLIDTYRHFLDKNKLISENAKIPNKNFLTFTGELLNIKLQPDDYNLKDLRKRIIETNSVGYKAWLLEKIDEIEAK